MQLLLLLLLLVALLLAPAPGASVSAALSGPGGPARGWVALLGDGCRLGSPPIPAPILWRWR